jgi:hypothetical protein
LSKKKKKKDQIAWPTLIFRTSPPPPLYLRRQTFPRPLRVMSK